MVHAPILPRYQVPLKGWQLHHSESKFWSQHLAAQQYSFSFSFFSSSQRAAEIGDPTDITAFTLFPLRSRRLCCHPPRAQCDPRTLCCYFQYKISIQGLLDASHCLFLTPPTCFPLNARQIEHFWKLALLRPMSFLEITAFARGICDKLRANSERQLSFSLLVVVNITHKIYN